MPDLRHTVAALALVCSVALPEASAAAAPGGDRALQRYAGKWVSEGEFVLTPYSHNTHVTGTTTCQWSPMRNSLVCDQAVRAGAGEQRDTALYAYDPSANAYRYAEFPFDGSPPHITQLTIAGDTWRYFGGFGDAKGGHVVFRTTDVFSGDDERWRVEFSLDDGKKWIQMGAGSAKHVGN